MRHLLLFISATENLPSVVSVEISTLPLGHSGFRAVAHQHLLDLRSSARRGLLGLRHALRRCNEVIAYEATTFCKQLYIAACNPVFSNLAFLTAAG